MTEKFYPNQDFFFPATQWITKRLWKRRDLIFACVRACEYLPLPEKKKFIIK